MSIDWGSSLTSAVFSIWSGIILPELLHVSLIPTGASEASKLLDKGMSADTHQTVIQKRIEQEHIGMLGCWSNSVLSTQASNSSEASQSSNGCDGKPHHRE